MPRTGIKINTVKAQADIKTPTILIGYLVDGTKSVPMAQGNRDYREVQKWIAEGNTTDDAYTQQELADYTHNKEVQEAVRYLAETDWYLVRKLETGEAEPDEVKAKRTAARLTADGNSH